MKQQRVKIFFEDEAPRLGCGWRYVTVTIGRKWVRCRDCLGRSARFTLAQYERLKPIAL
ncbi:MAG TPA: hypothetical protein VFB29_00500 [Pseudolabrys sp.]|nr:hypothetical protein [Pseudolabrys sp.]